MSANNCVVGAAVGEVVGATVGASVGSGAPLTISRASSGPIPK